MGWWTEHGLSPDPGVARSQHRLEQRYLPGLPSTRPFGYLDVGTARRPA